MAWTRSGWMKTLRPLNALRRTQPAPLSPALLWVTALAFVALSMALLTAALEWEHYRRSFWAFGLKRSLLDRVVLLWMLWFKSVLVMLPVLAVCGVLAILGRTKWTARTLVASWIAVAFWLVVDMRVQTIYGAHVLNFLPYVQDALAMPMEANHLEWGGDPSGMLLAGGGVLLATTLAGIVLWKMTGLFVTAMARRRPRLAGRRAVVGVTLLWLTPVAGVVLAQVFSTNPAMLRRSKALLPVDVTFLDDWSRAVASACGWGVTGFDEKPGVRIISLFPNPDGYDDGREQVHLHNFGPAEIDLAGWRLEDRAGNEMELQGSLSPRGTRVIKLPANVLPLNNTSDSVSLFDRRRAKVHEVSYDGVKKGSLVTFRSHDEFNEFEVRLSRQVAEAYRQYHPQMQRGWPADEEAHFQRDDPPNVIFIVLESFRDAAVSPHVMGRLDRWAKRGTRLARHYAGSNSSHFGLFTLLYGRSPMVYEPTLDAGAAPQAVVSLRNSGYESFFLTAGDCRGFRRMGEFLSEEHFDGVYLEQGECWTDRPQRDKKVLAEIGRLCSEEGAKPRFITAFLMSTHFPYTFPPEWDRNRPSGENVSYANWRKTDRQVLKNRYANVAQFLEHEILKLVESLDPKRNLFVITGDHGESLSEDGALAHASRASEPQCRVPLLMVGPGVPAGEIHRATTHTDILPTVLGALAGRRVPIRHCHGRDVLREEIDDEALIFAYRWRDPYDLLLIRGQERLLLHSYLKRPYVEVFGFCDESANLDLQSGAHVSPDAVMDWSLAFRRQMLRVVR